jgi:hypothetical protein
MYYYDDGDYDHFDSGTSLRELWLIEQHEKAVKSYTAAGLTEEDYKYCSRCGDLMVYDSMAYHEGWHFDSCE